MAIETGTRVTSATAHGKHGHSLISEQKFRQLYERALTIHLAGRREEWLRGREAALAGVTADMLASDVVIAEFASSVEDIARGRVPAGMDRRSFEERVIEGLSNAVADRLRRTGCITAMFFEAAAPSAVLEQARSMAIGARLPVILVEVGTAKANRNSGKSQNAQRTLEYPSIPVDTQDVIAMYRVAHESITRAREGNGPTHIVGLQWHIPAADARKRSAKAKPPDAVQHLEEWLIARGLPVQEWRREIVTEFAVDKESPRFNAQNTDSSIEEEDTEARAIA